MNILDTKYRIADHDGWFAQHRPDVKQPLDIFLARDLEQYIQFLLGYRFDKQIRRELEAFMTLFKVTPR